VDGKRPLCKGEETSVHKGHVPLRTCLICRKKKEKKTLIRLTVQADGSMTRDPKQRAAGRGYYVCDDPFCLERLLKKENKKSLKNRGNYSGS